MKTVDLLRGAWLSLLCGMAYTAVVFGRMILKRKHPLCWPVDLEMLTAGFRVSLSWGNLATLRMLLGVMAHPLLLLGVKVQVIKPPGCEKCFLLRLRTYASSMKTRDISKSSSSTASKLNVKSVDWQPDVLLCYVHGGAFVAGHPLMCARTLQRWMQQLDSQGVHVEVLCISYPLAPEHPFPAAVASTAAAYAWVAQQFPNGCSTTFIAVGDSAGGNITVTALAALRDYLQQGMAGCSFQSKQTAPAVPPALPRDFAGAGASCCATHSSSKQDYDLCSIPSAASGRGGTTAEDSNSLKPTSVHDSMWVSCKPVAAIANSPLSVCQYTEPSAPTHPDLGFPTGCSHWQVAGSSVLEADIQMQLFADLHSRLTDMGIQQTSDSSSPGSLQDCSDHGSQLPAGGAPSGRVVKGSAPVMLETGDLQSYTPFAHPAGPCDVNHTGTESSDRSFRAQPSSFTAEGTRMRLQMPSAMILVSPATDVSPSAFFRSPKTLMDSIQDVTEAATEGVAAADGTTGNLKMSLQQQEQQQQTATARCLQQEPQSCTVLSADNAATMSGSHSASILTSTDLNLKPYTEHDSKPHYDYLPEKLEARGMGTYVAHPGHLCCAYASPVHLASLTGLCTGRVMVVSGGVEILAADINRFVAKLQMHLGEAAVVHHVEELLPHSWAMLPLPSMWPYQQLSAVRFIAEEHAAAVGSLSGNPRCT